MPPILALNETLHPTPLNGNHSIISTRFHTGSTHCRRPAGQARWQVIGRKADAARESTNGPAKS
ncbi:hypothetical protein SAMCCGM7_pA0346 (plasmid) [Sinorhizobium americanum CCGM7]|nr:hypothetical protein SAMCCGM7_pA0346 [Sinorhizobium americanum CCGM7]